MYDKDDQGSEKYEVDSSGNDILLKNRYARNKDGIPFYPRQSTGSEFMGNLGLIWRNGEYVYPLKLDGRPHYRVDGNLNEYYERVNGKWIIGKGADGNEYYALDKEYREFYPADNTPARKADGSIFYARGAFGQTVFPVDSNQHEYYFAPIDVTKDEPSRYASQGNTEIYPKRMTLDGLESECVLNGQYASQNGDAYYPKDGHNNEMYIHYSTAPAALLSAYAVSNDGKVILPSNPAKLNEYYIDPKLNPPISEEHVLGRLIQEKTIRSQNYLTSVDAPIKPQVEPKRYKYYDLKTNIITIPEGWNEESPLEMWYIVWVIVLIAEVLLMWLPERG